MCTTYVVDFHIPVKGLARDKRYILQCDQALTARALLGVLAERFATIRTLMSFGGGKRPPVAVLVDGQFIEMDAVVPEGAEVKIIGAVAGG